MGSSNLFHRGHYNILAAQIRTRLEQYDDSLAPDFIHDSDMGLYRATRRAITNELYTFSVELAKRLKQDNERFDPVVFLEACSPNLELYPMGELWENEN